MASPSLYPQYETNLMSNRKVTELLLQLKRAKDHGKNYIKVKPHLVRHFLRNCLLHLENRPGHGIKNIRNKISGLSPFLLSNTDFRNDYFLKKECFTWIHFIQVYPPTGKASHVNNIF